MANEPRVLQGVTIDLKARVTRCSACQRLIWFGFTQNGRRCPFDFDPVTNKRTAITHWSTCPRRQEFIESRRSA